jgi:hypothetical protein
MQFSFTTRTRRPPRDPVNAMLSFGYTLLGTLMESAILRVGLDPMLGVFHTPEYGRPSLMLDLIEEFRPVVVDALALRVVNRREVAAEDFEELMTRPSWPPSATSRRTGEGGATGLSGWGPPGAESSSEPGAGDSGKHTSTPFGSKP